MTTISNVINDLHFCCEVQGASQSCPNCTHKGMKDNKRTCDEILISDAIGYLREYRRILDAADPNNFEWVLDLVKRERLLNK